MNNYNDMIGIIDAIKNKIEDHLKANSCCKKPDDSPAVDAVKVYGDYIRLEDGSFYHLDAIKNFSIIDKGIHILPYSAVLHQVLYTAKSTEEAQKVLDGLMNALCVQKYQHMNAIVEQLNEIDDSLLCIANTMDLFLENK